MTDLVAAVIGLTDRVEAAIEAGDWATAQALEAERRRLLERLALAHASWSKDTFAAIEARTVRLIGLVEQEKRRVLREAAVARAANDGATAYSTVGNPAVTSIA